MLIGGLNVRVGSNHGRNLSVKESAQRNFLTSSLTMYVHDNVRSVTAHFRHSCFDRMKRVFQNRLHKCARLHVDDTDLSLGRFQDDRSAARRSFGIIHGPQQTRLGVDKRKNFFLVPHVIAGGDDRDAGAQEIDCDLSRDTATAAAFSPLTTMKSRPYFAFSSGSLAITAVQSRLTDYVAQDENR